MNVTSGISIGLVAKARELSPELRLRALDAERQRSISVQTVAQLKQAGFFKMTLPKRVGGFELPLQEMSDVLAEIGKGCGSTAWMVSVINAHHWILGLFPEDVQDEVFQDRETLLAAVPTPRGKAEPVEEGYKLSGFWPFCSGSAHASWVGLGARIVGDGNNPMKTGIFLMPVSEIEIQDDWNVSGLRATGSNSIVAKSVFVPNHRVLDAGAALDGARVNLTEKSGDLYRTPFAATLALTLSSPAFGMAMGAFESFVATLPGRKLAYGDQLQIEHAITHAKIGEAAIQLEMGRLLLSEHAAMLQAARSGKLLEFSERARIRMIAAQTVRLSLQAVENLFSVAGGAAISEQNPLQRASRDLHAASSHGHVMYDINAEMFGRVKLNLPTDVPLI